FLNNGISPVPQGERKAEPLLVVGKPCQAIFPPMLGACTCLIVAAIARGIAIVAVIFPYRSPLAFGQVGTPFLPRDLLIPSLIQSLLLRSLIQVAHSTS